MASMKMEMDVAYVLLSSVALTGFAGLATSSTEDVSQDFREEESSFEEEFSSSFVTRHAPSARHRVLMMIGHHASSSHSSHAHGSLPAGKSDQADVGHGVVSNDIAGGSGGAKTIATTSAAQELAALVQAADPTVALDIARALMRIKSIDAVVDIGVLAAALVGEEGADVPLGVEGDLRQEVVGEGEEDAEGGR